MIVDTSFVLDIIDDVDPTIQKERELEAESVSLVIPSMTALKLYIGVGKATNTLEERQQVEAVLDSYPVAETRCRSHRRTPSHRSRRPLRRLSYPCECARLRSPHPCAPRVHAESAA
ncbi:PilT protein domain-containing protein [Natrialba hulunbeirensis JCM 10989]|uniref:PilT protein domain-containing protein n=1 Tax=Natrialba hulunbeirensis JCM 10989 TaxID=1227493 RepID=M0AB74_9EURY|nr:PilT protein domain-containing protein [Natrialba hulunbeirensis JCM 10989]